MQIDLDLRYLNLINNNAERLTLGNKVSNKFFKNEIAT